MKRLFIVLLMTMIVSTGRTYATTSIESSKKTERQERLINFTMHVFPKEAKIKIGKHKFQTNDGILNVQLPAGQYKYKISAKGHKTAKNMLYLGAHVRAMYETQTEYYKGRKISSSTYFDHLIVKDEADSLYTHVDIKQQQTWAMYTTTPWFISLDPKTVWKYSNVSFKSPIEVGKIRIDNDYNKHYTFSTKQRLLNKEHRFYITHPLSKEAFHIFANITKDTVINITVPDSLKILKRKVKIAYEPKDSIKVTSYLMKSQYGHKSINPHEVQLGATPITHEYYPGTYRLNYEIDNVFYYKDITIDYVQPSNKDSVTTIFLDKANAGEILKAKEVITG